MITEAEVNTRDARLLEGFTLQDIDLQDLKALRNAFRATRPDHPWLALDDCALLQSLGGCRRDRQMKTEAEWVLIGSSVMLG